MAIAAGVEGQQQESRLPTPALAPAEPAGVFTRLKQFGRLAHC